MKYILLFRSTVLFCCCLLVLCSCNRQKTISSSPEKSPNSIPVEIEVVEKEVESNQEVAIVSPAEEEEVKLHTADNTVLLESQNDKTGLQQFIRTQEQELFKDIEHYNVTAAQNTLNAYLKYIKDYPKDKDYTPVTMFKASELYRSLKQFDSSIQMMTRITEEFPKFDKAPDCQFLIGFTYENNIKDLEKAQMAYEYFLKKYPKHELKEDVIFSLKFLGKTPEEIIKMVRE